jgi:hypothetical protein
MARFRDGRIELKCRRCKRTLVIPCDGLDANGVVIRGEDQP